MVHYAVTVDGKVIGSRSSKSHAERVYTHALIIKQAPAAVPPERADGVVSYHGSERLALDAQRAWRGRLDGGLYVVPVIVTATRYKVGTVVRVMSDECPKCSRIGTGDLCKRHRAEYDVAQTEKCDRLRALLQSIALLAVAAQDMDPSGDPLVDQLGVISDDLDRATNISAALNRNDVFAVIK